MGEGEKRAGRGGGGGGGEPIARTSAVRKVFRLEGKKATAVDLKNLKNQSRKKSRQEDLKNRISAHQL